MSPGDGSYAKPYYYVSPWPYPPASRLPALKSPGRWHTEGWVGAVLTSDQFVNEEDQADIVRSFLDEAVAALK